MLVPSPAGRFDSDRYGLRQPQDGRSPAGSRSRPYTVAELNASIQSAIENAHPAVWILGEISNLSPSSSGHLYFTLKDSGSEIAVVVFASAVRRLRFEPADGAQVLACGRPTLWVPRGRYQFVVAEMEPRGRGDRLEAFEALKQRLLAEGLFDAARKRPIPLLPRRIGIVTSPDGAALRDILKVLTRRHAGVDVLLAAVRVQGDGAAAEIAAAIEAMGRFGGIDALIVGRGGGSIEDLWAFNEEIVARAIAASPVPVISAVGHETDVTIADFAADLRSATPSQAAELVVASRQDLAERLGGLRARLYGAVRLLHADARRCVEGLVRHPAFAELPARIAEASQTLDDLTSRLRAVLRRRLEAGRSGLRERRFGLSPRHLLEFSRRRREALRAIDRRLEAAIRTVTRDHRARAAAASSLLQSLSPTKVLQRGYAICLDPVTRRVVRSADEIDPGTAVAVRLARGRLDCRVLATHAETEEPS